MFLKLAEMMITIILFVIFPQKADFLSFSVGERDNGQQFEQLIYRDHFIFY